MTEEEQMDALLARMTPAERAAHAELAKELAEDNERERLQREANVAERQQALLAMLRKRKEPLAELQNLEVFSKMPGFDTEKDTP